MLRLSRAAILGSLSAVSRARVGEEYRAVSVNVEVVREVDRVPAGLPREGGCHATAFTDGHEPVVRVCDEEVAGLSVEPQPERPATPLLPRVLLPRRRLHSIRTNLLRPF